MFSGTLLHPEARLNRGGVEHGVAAECRVCGNIDGNAGFIAREMVLGFRDGFEYIECARCHCVQIAEFPRELDHYYPQDYYEYLEPTPAGRLTRALKRARARHVLGHPNLLGRMLQWRFGPPRFADWVLHVGARYDSAILDIGCGRGTLIVDMAECGFENVTGIDARIEDNVQYENGARVLSTTLADATGSYDVAMMHHVFEHFDDPLGALESVHRLLKPLGHLVIRMPVANRHAWETYGPNWVQLDAPRHVFVHTPESLKILADQAGFAIADVVYDSTSFQFWGSEQYARGIPLRDERSYAQRAVRSVFTPEEIAMYSRWAADLNRDGRGDQAVFYLRRI